MQKTLKSWEHNWGNNHPLESLAMENMLNRLPHKV